MIKIKHCPEKVTNSLVTREESFLAKALFISQKLTRTTRARPLLFTGRNLSPLFIPEKLTFSHCLRTKNVAKNSPIHVEGSFVQILQKSKFECVSNLESPRFSRPQSTASHLFARTRSFHRPTYKRPDSAEFLRSQLQRY